MTKDNQPAGHTAEAEKRYELTGRGSFVDAIHTHCRAAFVAGAEWQADSTAPSGKSYFDLVEPAAEQGISPEHAMLASIAISLKRIADAQSAALRRAQPEQSAQQGEG